MTDSTKERIKQAALSIFAQRGYYGTAMNDIAKLVGIKTPSIYAHYKGKEELFTSIYDDLAKDYVDLMEELINTAESMDIEAGLYYIFEQYIIHFMTRPEVRDFWNQVPISTPSELREKLFSYSREYDLGIEKRLAGIIAAGIRQGKLRDDDPLTMSFSHRLMRDGIKTWISVIPEINNEKYIKAFWNNLWFGLKK